MSIQRDQLALDEDVLCRMTAAGLYAGASGALHAAGYTLDAVSHTSAATGGLPVASGLGDATAAGLHSDGQLAAASAAKLRGRPAARPGSGRRSPWNVHADTAAMARCTPMVPNDVGRLVCADGSHEVEGSGGGARTHILRTTDRRRSSPVTLCRPCGPQDRTETSQRTARPYAQVTAPRNSSPWVLET